MSRIVVRFTVRAAQPSVGALGRQHSDHPPSRSRLGAGRASTPVQALAGWPTGRLAISSRGTDEGCTSPILLVRRMREVPMTLNITVLSQGHIWLSSDHRLWDEDKARMVSDHSNKIVHVVESDWHGVVTYTGVGRVGYRDTSEYIVKWLSGMGSLTLDEAVDAIARRGTTWLGTLRVRHNHTFVVAAFYDGMASVTAISNFQRLGSPPSGAVTDVLEVSRLYAGRRPQVLVTGCLAEADPMARTTRRRLMKLVADRADPAVVRRELQRANRSASRRGPAGLISEDCLVYSFDSAGRGQTTGAPPGAGVRSVNYGVDVGGLLENVVRDRLGPGAQLIGSTFTAFGAAEPSDVMEPCHPVQSAGSAGSWSTAEVDSDSRRNNDVSVITSAGVAYGISSDGFGMPTPPCRFTGRGHVFLDPAGGSEGRVLAIGADDLPYGYVVDSERRSRACKWTAKDSLIYLDVVSPGASAVRCAGRGGVVGGWVADGDPERGQLGHRAAVWVDGQECTVLSSDAAEWWETVAVIARDLYVVQGYTGRDSTIALWQGVGEPTVIADPSMSCQPVGVDDVGRVYGWVRTAEGVLTLRWTNGKGWQRLPIPLDWVPRAVSQGGGLVGTCSIDGWDRPWVSEADGLDAVLLPHFRDHGSIARFIAPNATVVGRCFADRCSHAIVWSKHVAPSVA